MTHRKKNPRTKSPRHKGHGVRKTDRAPALILLIAAMFLGACAGTGPAAQVVGYEDFCKLEMNEKRVALEGYVRMDGFTMCSNQDCKVMLYRRPAQRSAPGAQAELKYQGKNGMEKLPKRFKHSDFALYDLNGEKIGYGQPARLHGKVWSFKSSGADAKVYCTLKVDRVEKLSVAGSTLAKVPAPQSIGINDFCNVKYDEAYVRMKGYLKIPPQLFCMGDCTFELFATPALSGPSITASFARGSGPNEFHQGAFFKQDGKPAAREKELTLTGGVWVTTGSPSKPERKCRLMVERIEQ